MNLCLLALPLALLFQDPQPPGGKQESVTTSAAATVYENLEKQIQAIRRPGNREEEAKRAEQVRSLTKAALTENAAVLAAGDGLHWRGKIEALAGDHYAATSSFEGHAAEAKADPKLVASSKVQLASLKLRTSPEAAKAILAGVNKSMLDDAAFRQFKDVDRTIRAPEIRTALTGKSVPAIDVIRALNTPKGFEVNKLQGKVVVLDFWATWCQPCRALIPNLVALQDKHGKDNLQVVGLTRFYGNGMDFAATGLPPHGGKMVAEIDKETEVSVNESFVKAFQINYPILFTHEDLATDVFGVSGVPTTFVIGRDGKIVGHVVGGEHNRVSALVETALNAVSNGK